MATDLLVANTDIYLATAVLFALASVAFLALGVRQTGYTRRVLLLGTVPTVAMAIAYSMMGLELFTVTVTGTEREQSVARFFAYTAVLFTVMAILRELIGFSKRQFALLFGVFTSLPWLTFASWLTVGAGESAASGLALVMYLTGSYLFYGPFARIARETGGERQLLYIKICHLAVLTWGILALTSVLSEQSAGVLDGFVGQLAASYTDLIFMVVFTGLVYNSRSIFQERLPSLTGGSSAVDRSMTDATAIEDAD